MASYAALISLRHSIMQIKHHPRPPISLDKTRIRSLVEKCVFLLEFLLSYPRTTTKIVARFSFISEEVEALEGRMADASYAAEDLIDSHIVDQIQAASTSTHISSIDDGLDKVIEDLESIVNDVTEIKERMIKLQEDDPLQEDDLVPPSADVAGASTSRGSSSSVGLDDVLIEVIDKLTGPQSNRQIIPIVGMGGIGKTTLAKNVYANPLIVHHFDILAWATVSHEFNSKQILSDILLSLKNIGSGEHEMSEHEIGERLYKNLRGRRYLIVMDDMWSIEAWDKLGFFFPDNNNRSRIVITTREWNLVSQLNFPRSFQIGLLNEDESWNLLCKSVFGKKDCPVELEEIGKKIAKNCKGLPLSIVVIGGLLAKSNPTQQHWRYIAENLNAIVNLEDNERCFKTLRLSYNQLPVALKPLFLYMGIFPEDHKIHVSTLIRLWVAEGILIPINGESLEKVAIEGLKNLIRRNLIFIRELSSAGNIKVCSIHDLLRDLSIKEAEKEKLFFGVANTRSLNIGQSWRTQRRIGIHKSTFCDEVQSASLARSLICNNTEGSVVPTTPYRLLRVLNVIDKFGLLDSLKDIAYPLEDIFHLVNLRHLSIVAELPQTEFPSSIYHLWNLQTLVVNSDWSHDGTAPLFDIWKMPKLRHVKVHKLMLPDPPMDNSYVVLWNLQTLHGVYKFKCDEDVVKRIPNIKKLRIIYDDIEDLSPPSNYCLNNLCQLLKLESLSCSFRFGIKPSSSESPRNLITFPHSLKKLTLQGTRFSWEDMAMKIGSLPCLKVLKIERHSFLGPEWETVEDQFRSLKYLRISNCYDLEYWRTESSHFPCLEHLVVVDSQMLKELPSEIGDIPTLNSIDVRDCSDSVVISAKKIQNEQEELGNEGLSCWVLLSRETQLRTEVSLVGNNFHVYFSDILPISRSFTENRVENLVDLF